MRHLIRKLPLIFLFLLSACGLNQPAPPANPLPPLVTKKEAVTIPSPNAPIKLTIDTELLGKSYSGNRKVIDLNPKPFQIQSVPDGPIVFQETFSQDVDITRTFKVTDTTKRYTLHIQSKNVSSAVININGFDWITPDDFHNKKTLEVQRSTLLLQVKNYIRITFHATPSAQMTVTVVEGGKEGLVARDSGLMNEHLGEHAHSKSNAVPNFDPSFAGSLGQLLPDLPGNHETPVPETHTTTISINGGAPTEMRTGMMIAFILNPVENLQKVLDKYHASLLTEPIGGFYPLRPDMTKISLVNMETNIRRLNELLAPHAVIQEAKFPTLEAAKTFAFALEVMLDEDILIADLDTMLKPAAAAPIDTTEASYGSTEGGSTNVFTSPSVSPSAFCASGDGLTVGNSTILFPQPRNKSAGANDAWWLNEQSTAVNRAWNYSTGFKHGTGALNSGSYPKPVEIAVIEPAFYGLPQAVQAGDLQGQVSLEKGGYIQYEIDTSTHTSKVKFTPWTNGIAEVTQPVLTEFSKDDLDKESHGIMVAALIAGNMNNGQGIVGVAPHAKIIPFLTGPLKWDVGYAIQNAIKNKVDVINVSMEDPINDDLDNVINVYKTGALNPADPTKQAGIQALLASVQSTANSKVIIVAAAGNGEREWSFKLPSGQDRTVPGGPRDAQFSFPGGGLLPGLIPVDPKLASVISVGGVEDTNTCDPSLSTLRRWNNPNNTAGFPQGSNFGPSVDIWAPANVISLVFDFSRNQNVLKTIQGTSFATPIVAGTVALMKALNPDLTPAQVKATLISTGRQISIDKGIRNCSSPPTKPGDIILNCTYSPGPVPVLNAEAAVASVASNLSYTTFTGKYLDNGGFASGPTDKYLLTMGNVWQLDARLAPAPSQSPAKTLSQLQTGSGVEIQGWQWAGNPFIKTVNVLKIKEIPAPTFTILSVVPPSVGGHHIDFGIQSNTAHETQAGSTGVIAIQGDKTDLRIKLQNQTTAIGGVQVPILAIVEDLVAFGIPADMPPGLYNLIVETVGGQMTLQDIVRIIALTQPSPSPSSGGSQPPVIVSAPVRVSFLGGASNIIFPFDPSVFSALKGIPDNFNNLAQWVGVASLSSPVVVDYPKVPDIREPNQTNSELPLRIDLQVAYNQGQGGKVSIGSATTNIGNVEGQVITVRFPFAASETTGRNIEIKLNGSDPHAQIIYVVKAEP